MFYCNFTNVGSQLCELWTVPAAQSMHCIREFHGSYFVSLFSRFIDNRLFATCSDDRTVKLWDLRNMEKEIQTLTGHTNWVKNIECIDGKLLTSGFDGNIIMWDYHT